MTKATTSWPTRTAKQLIPVSQLITIPEGIAVSFDHLQIADLADLPRGVTLVTFVGPSIKVLITKTTKLCVTVVCKITSDDPLVQKHSVKTVARTMSYATGMVPIDQDEAKRLPSLTSAGWKVPDEVTWQFDLPVTATETQVLAAVRASDEFIIKTTELLLTPEAKVQEEAVQS